ncbi:hypothetical protein GCM10010381_27900 [Streptomyces xantholiticus]|nr:hypothetical protein GCM10010381_27900 [Streptomyces xantholiticus]
MTGKRRWSPILDIEPRVRIPSPCWVKHPDPDRYDRCSESPGHTHRHYDWSTKAEWPNTGKERQ